MLTTAAVFSFSFSFSLFTLSVFCLAATTIPQLDLADWFNGNTVERNLLAKAWDKAMSEVGFCTIVNHGLSEQAMKAMYEATQNFFLLDLEEKKKYTAEVFVGSGYHPPGTESYDAESDNPMPDLLESFQFWRKENAPEEFVPETAPADLRAANVEYWAGLRKLQHVLYEISDQALELPAGTFANANNYSNPVLALRLNHFPPLSLEQQQKAKHRMGGHTDYFGFTILMIDQVAGLEVAIGEKAFDPARAAPAYGEWAIVSASPGALVINAGDFFRFWTNGRWKSAFHRVSAESRQRRISLAFFTAPSLHAR
eukprot:g843.t1